MPPLQKQLATLSAIILLCGAATPGPCQQGTANSMQVYFTETGTPFVLAGFGTTPAAMTVDTGAFMTLISSDLATQAGISEHFYDQDVNIVSTGQSSDGYITRAKDVSLGNAFADSMKITVMRSSKSSGMFGPKTEIDGSLGNDIWRNYDLDLDFPHATLTLYGPQSCPEQPMQWPGRIAQVPIIFDQNGYIFVPVTIDGHRLTAMLDTGTTISSLPPLVAAQAGLSQDAVPSSKDLRVETPSGGYIAGLYGFKQMSVGSVTIENPVLVMQPLDKDPSGAIRWEMILGEDFVRTHHIYISHATNTLYIQN